jgi:multidrug efflux pump subunit AcrB
MSRAVLLSLLLASPAAAGWSVEVTAGTLGLAPEEAERLIAIPLEAALASVKGVRLTTTTVQSGSTVVTLELEANADRVQVLQQVHQRLHQVNLPPGVSPVVASHGPVRAPAFWIGVVGTGEPLTMGRLVETEIEPAVRRIPGVAGIEVVGKASPEVRITLDPAKLQARALDASDIADRLAAFRSPELKFPDLHIPGIFLKKAEELNELSLKSTGQNHVYLRDVAIVELHAHLPSLAFLSGPEGNKPSVLLGVRIDEEKDAKSVREALARALPTLQKRLPEAVSVEVVADRFGLEAKLLPAGEFSVTFPAKVSRDEAQKVLAGLLPHLLPERSGGRVLALLRKTDSGFAASALLVGAPAPGADRMATLRPKAPGIALRWLPKERLDTRQPAAFLLVLPVDDAEAALKLVDDLIPRLRKQGEVGPVAPPAPTAEIRMRVDPQKLAQVGLTFASVRCLAELGQAGRHFLGYLDGTRCDILLRFPAKSEANQLEDLLELPLTSAEGRVIPLRSVATAERVASLSERRLWNGQRVWLVPFDPTETKPEVVTKSIEEALTSALKASGARLSGDAHLWPAGSEKPIVVKP